eukprot:1154983-Pelagomonas_calceolata.AAC.2
MNAISYRALAGHMDALGLEFAGVSLYALPNQIEASAYCALAGHGCPWVGICRGQLVGPTKAS